MVDDPVGILAMLCPGTVYAWSIFRRPLEQELGLGATASLLPFTVALVCCAGMMPPAVVASWFPERKGLAVGLTVIGFGLSPLITAPLAQRLIAGFGTRPTLLLVGLTFGAILLLTAWLLRPPPPRSAPLRQAPARAAMLAFALILAGSLLMLGAGPGEVTRYQVAFCLCWSTLGGWLAIAPPRSTASVRPTAWAP